DRVPKRRLLTFTQVALMVPALTLWGLTEAGRVQAWMVLALVLVRGSINAIDNPARQSFVVEMVGADRVANAIALNSVAVHSSRIIGPAAAGALIAGLGVGPCFLVNGLSFVVMLAALRTMNPRELSAPRPLERRGGELRSSFAYVRRTPELLVPLAMMAVVG